MLFSDILLTNGHLMFSAIFMYCLHGKVHSTNHTMMREGRGKQEGCSKAVSSADLHTRLHIRTTHEESDMTKTEIKKKKKRLALMDSAYHLFTTVGFQNTTITDIAKNADVGKGTFYLYFKDKEELRKAVVIRRSTCILNDAVEALLRQPGFNAMRFSDRIIFITDHILDYLSHDIAQLQLVSKYLSRGMLSQVDIDNTTDEDTIQFRHFIESALKKDGIELERVNMVVYTILELINSTCYNIILNGTPVTIGEYKPYLYRCIRLLIDDAVNTKAGGTLH